MEEARVVRVNRSRARAAGPSTLPCGGRLFEAIVMFRYDRDNAMKKALIIFGAVIGLIILFPVAHLAVWALIPPLSPHKLAKTGHFVSVDGIDTYYERYGSGPPLILVPAGGSHTSTWRFNTGALSRSHEVWTLDLPGSGYSEKPAAFPYTHRSYAEFVRDFMTSMGITKAVVAGHSLGGAVALEFSLDFPERTAGLVLIASGGYPRNELPGMLDLLVHRPFNPLVQRTINAILNSFGSYPFIVKAFYSFLYHDPTPFALDTESVQEICNINRTPNAWDAMYWMQRALNFDFALPDVSRIKSVAVPTLIVWGREDRIADVQTAARFQQDIAGSGLVVVDGAGHMVQEEKPDAVNNAITSFLDTIRW
jgi:4,5:9,10-diseco-3-hydroxy-5,9,17-trioxoandrosta-1(10),2-diene-4-oate hydrolase